MKNTFAFCFLAVIPVRAEHDDRSEIVTQLLFGEAVEILEEEKQWRKIRILHDNYEGWVDYKQLLPVSLEFLQKNPVLNRLQSDIQLDSTWGSQTIYQGSPAFSYDSEFKIGQFSFHLKTTKNKNRTEDISQLSMSYLNTPYLWGGRTKHGIDCSGFSQTIYHQLGINLNRDASQQAKQGREVSFKNKVIGDLAFFISEKTGNINHVGIILADSKIIHAHGRVRVDTLHEEGIYNEEKRYFSHKLLKIRRYQ